MDQLNMMVYTNSDYNFLLAQNMIYYINFRFDSHSCHILEHSDLSERKAERKCRYFGSNLEH